MRTEARASDEFLPDNYLQLKYNITISSDNQNIAKRAH